MITIRKTESSILTFGYGNRKTYDDFSNCLEMFNVDYVIDVRLSPKAWTRRWWRDKISQFCAEKQVNYISMPELGNISGKAQWIPPDNLAAEEAISRLSKIVEGKTILLLCAELDATRCHRSDVAVSLSNVIEATIKHLS